MMSIWNIHRITIRPPFFIHKTTIFRCYRPHLVGADPVTGVVLDLHTPAGCRGGFRRLGRWIVHDGNNIPKAIGSWSYWWIWMALEWPFYWWFFWVFSRGFQTLIDGEWCFYWEVWVFFCIDDLRNGPWSGRVYVGAVPVAPSTRSIPAGKLRLYPSVQAVHWSLGAQGGKDTAAGSFKDCYPHLIPSCYGSTLDFFHTHFELQLVYCWHGLEGLAAYFCDT